MTLTRLGLGNPVAVVVAVLLAIIFGVLSLGRLPIQLTPEVDQPNITITTEWRAAAPEEIESEIIEPQEDVLRGLPGMTEILATAQRGQGSISLTFKVGTDLRRALLEVLSRLNRVSSYPADANEPTLSSIGGQTRPIAWFMLKPQPGNERPITTYQDFAEEVVQSRFERVPGVALSEVRGGRERELRITFDPYKAASLGIQLPKVVSQVGGAEDTSGGFVDVGKRRYTLRFAGQYRVEDLGEMVLEWREGRPVYLRDVADIAVQEVDRTGFVIRNGEPSLAINAYRETGVNVLEVMAGLREAVAELSAGPVNRADLIIQQVYDETTYIENSIDMVRNNLLLGILLAIGVLWWFFRKFRATLMVAVAIPVCVITAFSLLDAADRTLNVISLAGLAFAVGMVLDAAIVVLESIVRLRERGVASNEAADEGTRRVWGALLASTATTVAIFLPIVFLEDEAGQLFADLALTIAVTVTLSLVVAVTVLPAAAATWLKNIQMVDPHATWWNRISDVIMWLTDSAWRRMLWIAILITVPLYLAWTLKPEADYLPEGNRNLVFAFILPPPGINVDTLESELGQVIAKRMQPYVDGEQEPRVKDYFFVAFGRGVFMGARTVDPDDTGAMVPLINRLIGGFPDTIAFARKAPLFGGFGGGTVDIHIQGTDIESLLNAAQAGFAQVMQAIPGRPPRPRPGLELAEPELRIVPDERRLNEAGWNRTEMAQIVRTLGNGLYVGDYFDGQERLDVILRGAPWSTPEELGAIPLVTPRSGVLPVSELTEVVRTAGPDEIRRLNRQRTITLEVNPPEGMSLEQVLTVLKEKVGPQIEPLLPPDGSVSYGGTADKLIAAQESMLGSFALAIAILYLLMSALFRSFLDSLLVLVALPQAIVGGVIGLNLINLVAPQNMDLLTMIGFIILLGLVVNNAILLVHQTRSSERDGKPRREAVSEAVHIRLRPILMSTLTSIFGMLPLLLVPGAGTELYRGLAAVIVGGMCVSTVFTLVLLPSLLRLGEGRSGAPQRT